MKTSMDDTTPPPDEPDEEARRHNRRRRWAIVALIAFVVGGVLLFGPRVPREVRLRFEVPKTVMSGAVAFERERASMLDAVILSDDSERVAAINVPLPDGMRTPYSAVTVLNLPGGRYFARVRVRSFGREEAVLRGAFEVDGEDVIVELQ